MLAYIDILRAYMDMHACTCGYVCINLWICVNASVQMCVCRCGNVTCAHGHLHAYVEMCECIPYVDMCTCICGTYVNAHSGVCLCIFAHVYPYLWHVYMYRRACVHTSVKHLCVRKWSCMDEHVDMYVCMCEMYVNHVWICLDVHVDMRACICNSYILMHL